MVKVKKCSLNWGINRLLARRIKLNLNKRQQRAIDELSIISVKLYNELLKINFDRLNNANTILSSYAMINLIRNEKISSDIKDRICNRVFNALMRYVKSEKLRYFFFQQYGSDYRKKLKKWCYKKHERIYGRPRFKTQSISLEYLVRKTRQKVVRVFGKYTSVNIPTIGNVIGFNDRQELFGFVKQVNISKDICHTYWATMVCDGEKPKETIEPIAEDIGIDLGLKHTITCANEKQVIQPERGRFLDKQISTIQKLSRSYKRALPYVHRKIARRRKHSHHVMAKQAVQAAKVIYIGNLNSQFLFSSKLARSASDAAHSQFKQILAHKAANAGGKVVMVNESHTSQTCACLNILEFGRTLNSRETTAGV